MSTFLHEWTLGVPKKKKGKISARQEKSIQSSKQTPPTSQRLGDWASLSMPSSIRTECHFPQNSQWQSSHRKAGWGDPTRKREKLKALSPLGASCSRTALRAWAVRWPVPCFHPPQVLRPVETPPWIRGPLRPAVRPPQDTRLRFFQEQHTRSTPNRADNNLWKGGKFSSLDGHPSASGTVLRKNLNPHEEVNGGPQDGRMTQPSTATVVP